MSENVFLVWVWWFLLHSRSIRAPRLIFSRFLLPNGHFGPLNFFQISKFLLENCANFDEEKISIRKFKRKQKEKWIMKRPLLQILTWIIFWTPDQQTQILLTSLSTISSESMPEKKIDFSKSIKIIYKNYIITVI